MLRYCRKEDVHFILDWHTYPSTIVKRLKGMSFFKRFSNFTSQFPELFDGAEVVTLKKDQVLFLEGKVGIILEGSIVSNSHADNLLKPFVIKKNVEGGILGFEKGDNDLGENPLVWHIANEDATDLLLVTAK